MYGIALGVLKLSPDVFWEMTLQEYNYVYYSYYKTVEKQHQSEWERTRWLSLTLIGYLSQAKPSQKPTIKTKGFAFPWDKVEKPKWMQNFKSFEEYKKFVTRKW